MAIVQQVQDGKILETSNSTKKEQKTNDLGYDQFLQILCAEMQYQDPLEPTSNTEYIAQLATFSQLESTLSMQDTVEGASANNLVGQYVIMKVTSSETGQTNLIEGYCDYVLHQNGETYLSVNGGTYSLDDLYTVADANYMEAVSMADIVHQAIALLPTKDNVTLANKDDIQTVRTFYDSLTSYQKQFVDDDTWASFTEIETRLNELLAAQEASGGNTSGTDDAGSTGDTDNVDGAESDTAQ